MRDGQGMTPAMLACSRGALSLVRTLMMVPQQEEEADAGPMVEELLLIAGASGFADVVAYLLEGRGLSCDDVAIRKVLVAACEAGHADVVAALVKAGASVRYGRATSNGGIRLVRNL